MSTLSGEDHHQGGVSPHSVSADARLALCRLPRRVCVVSRSQPPNGSHGLWRTNGCRTRGRAEARRNLRDNAARRISGRAPSIRSKRHRRPEPAKPQGLRRPVRRSGAAAGPRASVALGEPPATSVGRSAGDRVDIPRTVPSPERASTARVVRRLSGSWRGTLRRPPASSSTASSWRRATSMRASSPVSHPTSSLRGLARFGSRCETAGLRSVRFSS